jgi:cytochrome bd ubiquinol oxidase subunit I
LLGSIIMFSAIYVLLFALWVYVLNHKIQAGPPPVTEPEKATARGLLDAAAERVDHEESMTEAKDEERGA